MEKEISLQTVQMLKALKRGNLNSVNISDNSNEMHLGARAEA